MIPMRASKQLTYSVLKPFRFAGRNYKPGMEFNARRLDPQTRQLQRWVDGGSLAQPGQKAAPVEVKEAPPIVEKAPMKAPKKSYKAPKEG